MKSKAGKKEVLNVQDKVDKAADKVENFLKAVIEELGTLAQLAGKTHVKTLSQKT